MVGKISRVSAMMFAGAMWIFSVSLFFQEPISTSIKIASLMLLWASATGGSGESSKTEHRTEHRSHNDTGQAQR